MNIANLQMVNRIADARAALLHQIAVLEGKAVNFHGLTVCIDGERQDDSIVELLRPIVLGELRARVRAFDRDLEQLEVGVG